MTVLMPLHVLGILLAVQLLVAGIMFGLGVRNILHNPTKDARGPADGYALVVSLCTGLFAIFGVWGVSELAERLGFGVDLGGHNAYGVFLIAFFGFIVIGVFLILIGRGFLLDLPHDKRTNT